MPRLFDAPIVYNVFAGYLEGLNDYIRPSLVIEVAEGLLLEFLRDVARLHNSLYSFFHYTLAISPVFLPFLVAIEPALLVFTLLTVKRLLGLVRIPIQLVGFHRGKHTRFLFDRFQIEALECVL